MDGFNANKVMWTVEELDAASAADKIWEAVAKYLHDHPRFSYKDVPGFLLVVGAEFNAIFKVVGFLFKVGTIPQNSMRFTLDRMKDVAVMLERDNDWLDKRIVE